MKQLITLALSMSLICWLNPSQAQTYSKGDVVIDAGIGLGATFSYAGGVGLPIGGSVEFAITDDIGVGGTVGFASSSGLTTLWVGARGAYHFNNLFNSPPENIDLYAGVSIMYRSYNFDGGNFILSNLVYPGVFVGGRYYFSDNIGAHAEIGNGYGWIKVGVSFRL